MTSPRETPPNNKLAALQLTRLANKRFRTPSGYKREQATWEEALRRAWHAVVLGGSHNQKTFASKLIAQISNYYWEYDDFFNDVPLPAQPNNGIPMQRNKDHPPDTLPHLILRSRQTLAAIVKQTRNSKQRL